MEVEKIFKMPLILSESNHVNKAPTKIISPEKYYNGIEYHQYL